MARCPGYGLNRSSITLFFPFTIFTFVVCPSLLDSINTMNKTIQIIQSVMKKPWDLKIKFELFNLDEETGDFCWSERRWLSWLRARKDEEVDKIMYNLGPRLSGFSETETLMLNRDALIYMSAWQCRWHDNVYHRMCPDR